MHADSPAIQRLTAHLLAQEASGADRPHEAALRALDRLCPVLTLYFGLAAYRTLLGRALALARAEDLSLASLGIADDGSLRTAPDHPPHEAAGGGAHPRADPAHPTPPGGPARGGAPAGTDGAPVVLAHLLALLVTFIGEPLTHQLITRVWPHAPDGPDPAPPPPRPASRDIP